MRKWLYGLLMVPAFFGGWLSGVTHDSPPSTICVAEPEEDSILVECGTGRSYDYTNGHWVLPDNK